MQEKIIKSTKAKVWAKKLKIYKESINRTMLGNKLRINGILFVDYGKSSCLSSFTEKTKLLDFNSKFLNVKSEKLMDSFLRSLSSDYIYRTKKRLKDIYSMKGIKDKERVFNQLREFNKSNPIVFH